jgi:hypothetical protein
VLLGVWFIFNRLKKEAQVAVFKMFSQILTVFSLVLMSVTAAIAADRSVSPAISYFGTGDNGTDLNDTSESVMVTIANNDSSNTLAINSLVFSGDVSQYSLVDPNDCANAVIPANGSCVLEVSYAPTLLGSYLAYVVVDATNSGTNLTEQSTAFFSNDEANEAQAIRRLPAVLESLQLTETSSGVIVDTEANALATGTGYTLSWDLLGYDVRYASSISVYACSAADVADDSCAGSGASALSSSSASELVKGVDSVPSVWTFLGNRAETYTFTGTFTTPLNSDVVAIRFFNRSGPDIAGDEQFLSLIIPGNLPGIGNQSGYIGSDGRRIYFTLASAP